MPHLTTRVQKENAPPAHLQVRERILEAIRAGQWAPGEKLPGEPEIAQRLGVSRMTANKAILGLVADGHLTREKGRGTYVAAPQLEGATILVAMGVEPEFANEDYYLGSLSWRLHGALAREGARVHYVHTRSLSEEAPPAGIVAINPHEEAMEDLHRLSRRGAAVVVLGATWDEFGLASVDSDNLLGSALAVNHLVDQGHRRVLFVGGRPADANTRDRVRGFVTAAKARGLDSLPPLLQTDAFGLETEEAIFSHLEDGVTAVFAGGAHLAMRVLGAAHRRGVRVPDRFSLVGYDDPDFLGIAYPPVTTIRQPLAEMAQAAAEILRDRLATGDPRPVQRLLDPILVGRESVADHRP